MERWLEHLSSELGVENVTETDALLNAAKVVAHTVERRATPVTTYLIGLAAAKEEAGPGEVEAICRRVVELARSWEKDGDDSESDE